MTCSNLFQHTQVVWPQDPMGQPQCPFDDPIRRDGFDATWYWGFTPFVLATGFDDAARQAHEYDLDDEPIQVRDYTDEENARADAIVSAAAVLDAQAALDRAVQVNAAPDELTALQEATLAEEGIEPGDPWRQPTGAQNAYPLGAIVTHVDKTWESLVAANVWEPGVSGWRETGAGCPEWVQPTGSHDAYNTGDCVTFEGACYVSTMDANVWSPTDLPSGWDPTECL